MKRKQHSFDIENQVFQSKLSMSDQRKYVFIEIYESLNENNVSHAKKRKRVSLNC